MNQHKVNLQVQDPFAGRIDEPALLRAVELALDVAQADSQLALSVVITDTATVQALNARHLGHDGPTDVLSFPAGDHAGEPDEPPYLGDVLIALPIAEQQALKAGYALQEEVHLLAVHGVLHLLGHDHETPDQQATMWALQSKALDALRKVGQ